MNHRELENYLELVSKMLRLSGKQNALLQEELRDHLEARIYELVEDGHSEEEAIRLAIQDFGDAAAMAQQFNEIAGIRRKRWHARFTIMATAASFLVILLVFATWPDNARFGAPDQAGAATDTAPNQLIFKYPPLDRERSRPTRQRDDKPDNSPVLPVNIALHQKLNQPVDVELNQMSLRDAMLELNQEFELNWIVDESAQVDLDRHSNVSLNMNQIPLEAVIDQLLGPANLTFLKREGCLLVISKNQSQEDFFFERRILDVGPLVRWMKSNQGTENQGDSIEELKRLVTNAVASSTWVDRGGAGQLQTMGHLLIVNNERRINNDVENFLQDLMYQVRLTDQADAPQDPIAK